SSRPPPGTTTPLLGFEVPGSTFWARGSGFDVLGSRFRVWRSGFDGAVRRFQVGWSDRERSAEAVTRGGVRAAPTARAGSKGAPERARAPLRDECSRGDVWETFGETLPGKRD